VTIGSHNASHRVLQVQEFSCMTFTVRGITKDDNPVQVTWRDGRLEGNLGLVKLLEAYVEAGEPIDVTPDSDVVKADLTDCQGLHDDRRGDRGRDRPDKATSAWD
jgi:hypothetical protein